MDKSKRVHKRGIKFLSLILCICLIIPAITSSAATSDDIANVKSKMSELDAQKNELSSKLDKLKAEEASKVEIQKTLAQKIEVLENQISQARIDIANLDENILLLEEKLALSEAEYEETIEQFKQIIVSLYKAGSTYGLTSLEILLNSNSLSEYTMKSEALNSVSKHDQQVVDKLEAYMAETESDRTELQTSKDEVAELKLGLESDKDELAVLQEENNALLAEIRESEASTEDDLSSVESERNALDEQLEALIAKKAEEQKKAEEEAAAAAAAQANSSSGTKSSGGTSSGSTGTTGSVSSTVSNGKFAWPIPGVTYISQHFGHNNHKGIDIAGPYGTKIVAAESGTVITANSTDSWGSSWGYYVLIMHDSTYTTRYAHLSSLAVSNGQYVTKGQVIGYEGSTGRSTGPHLHFEVYKNGTRVNPYPYIS